MWVQSNLVEKNCCAVGGVAVCAFQAVLVTETNLPSPLGYGWRATRSVIFEGLCYALAADLNPHPSSSSLSHSYVPPTFYHGGNKNVESLAFQYILVLKMKTYKIPKQTPWIVESALNLLASVSRCAET